MSLIARALFANFSLTLVPQSIRERLMKLYNEWISYKTDGKITVQEFVTFIQSALLEAMAIVKDLSDDATKKAVVMQFASALFDYFLPVIKQTLLGRILAFFGEDFLKQRFLDAVNLLVENFYHLYFGPKSPAALLGRMGS